MILSSVLDYHSKSGIFSSITYFTPILLFVTLTSQFLVIDNLGTASYLVSLIILSCLSDFLL